MTKSQLLESLKSLNNRCNRQKALIEKLERKLKYQKNIIHQLESKLDVCDFSSFSNSLTHQD